MWYIIRFITYDVLKFFLSYLRAPKIMKIGVFSEMRLTNMPPNSWKLASSGLGFIFMPPKSWKLASSWLKGSASEIPQQTNTQFLIDIWALIRHGFRVCWLVVLSWYYLVMEMTAKYVSLFIPKARTNRGTSTQSKKGRKSCFILLMKSFTCE